MGLEITITIDGGPKLSAELDDSATARKIAAALPLRLRMSRWGDEYYGSCGVHARREAGARTRMAVGEIAYWPPGDALCLFFGPTPASTGPEPEAASEVNPVGRIRSDPGALRKLGDSIRVEIEEGGPARRAK